MNPEEFKKWCQSKWKNKRTRKVERKHDEFLNKQAGLKLPTFHLYTENSEPNHPHRFAVPVISKEKARDTKVRRRSIGSVQEFLKREVRFRKRKIASVAK